MGQGDGVMVDYRLGLFIFHTFHSRIIDTLLARPNNCIFGVLHKFYTKKDGISNKYACAKKCWCF